MTKIDPKTAKIKALEEQIEAARRSESYERGRREEAQERLNKQDDDVRSQIRMLEHQNQEMQDTMIWMRQLVEMITIPADKMKQWNKARNQEVMRGRSY